MNQNPKRPNPKKPEMKKKPDYLIMIFTLIIVIGIFLFLRDALAGQVNELTTSEIQAAANAGHIESVEYELVGGDNYDLVIISGVIYEQHAALYDNVVLLKELCVSMKQKLY